MCGAGRGAGRGGVHQGVGGAKGLAARRGSSSGNGVHKGAAAARLGGQRRESPPLYLPGKTDHAPFSKPAIDQAGIVLQVTDRI